MLGEHRPCVARVLAEAGERVREEGTPADARLDPAARQDVDGGVVLGHPHRIEVHAERHARRQPQRGRPLGDRRQHHRWRRQDVVAEVVLTHVEAGEAVLLGQHGLVDDVAMALGMGAAGARQRIGDEVAEGEQPNVHAAALHPPASGGDRRNDIRALADSTPQALLGERQV